MNPLRSLSQQLTVIFGALLGAQVIFGAVVLLVFAPTPKNDPKESVLMVVCSALLFSGIVAGILVTRSKLRQLAEKSLEEKLAPYTALSIVRLAMIEGPVIASISFFQVTGNQIFTVYSAVGLVYFLTLFPSKARMARELEISEEEFLS